jgi:2-methylisocitrate lyase-like PEP mutase family enzyme
VDPSTINSAIDKLVAFADAGADCLYAPGVCDKGEIASIVRAVAPKPVNVVMMRPGLSLAELTDLGLCRARIGGAIARGRLGERHLAHGSLPDHKSARRALYP